MLKKKSIKAALNCNQISAYQTKKPLFRQMLKADKKCRLPSGVMLKHWTDTNRFAGIENKQTQSPLCSTSGCSQDSELPVRMHTCIPRSGTIGGATAAPAQTGKANLGKCYFQMASTDQTNPRERDVPYLWVRCLERAQTMSKTTPMTMPVLLQKITQVQERNTEQWWARIFALVWRKSKTLRKAHF